MGPTLQNALGILEISASFNEVFKFSNLVFFSGIFETVSALERQYKISWCFGKRQNHRYNLT